jgi:hypothetical protein
MTCKSCQSQSMSSFPADVRFYVNGSRTMSAPPMSPSPKVMVCLSCGSSEFTVPAGWLASGWLRPIESPVAFGVLTTVGQE